MQTNFPNTIEVLTSHLHGIPRTYSDPRYLMESGFLSVSSGILPKNGNREDSVSFYALIYQEI